jgi:hypothetical protein
MMSHPDEYGKRQVERQAPAQVEQFPSIVRQAQAPQDRQPRPQEFVQHDPIPRSVPPQTPEERAKPILDAIAEDILWLPWDLMETLAKEMLGDDGKAGVIVKWAKTRLNR